MNSPNRRDFIKRSGLLLGGLFLANRGNSIFGRQVENFTAPYKGLFLDMDESNLAFFHTGNQFGDGRSLGLSGNLFDVEVNYIRLHTGNFLGVAQADLSIITTMEELGVRAAALGSNELQLSEASLLAMAQKCSFSLIHSHATWRDSELCRWIKPFEIMQTRNRRIGVVAAGGNETVKNIQARAKIENQAKQLKEEQEVDMVICLVPSGWNKEGLQQWVSQSKYINTFFCTALDVNKGGNRVLKNAEGRDTLLSYGEADGRGMSKLTCNMERQGLVVPTGLSYKSL